MEQVMALTDSAFKRWTSLLESRTGVRVTPAWESHVRRSLAACLHARPTDLSPARRAAWWDELLDQLLIRETAFFRHRPSFDYLFHLLRARRQQGASACGLRLWSVGCASGEEAYSMAITASLALGGDSDFEVLASDISAAALAQARSASYSVAALASLRAGESDAFDKLDAGGVQPKAPLRERVRWIRHNLVEQRWPAAAGSVDVIFCQHVLVYFGSQQRTAVVDRLAHCLRPGGCLVLGPGEYLSRGIPGLHRDEQRDVLAFVRPPSGSSGSIH